MAAAGIAWWALQGTPVQDRATPSAFAAEYGFTSGTAVNVITKGGTNQYHGSLFAYFRDMRTSARNFFDRRAVQPSTLLVLATGLAAAGLRGHRIFAFLRGEGPVWPFAALLIYLSIIPVIVFVFLPKGRVYREALSEAEARGEVTARLRGAIADPVVMAARGYEFVMIAVLVFLMVAMPF